MSNENAGKEYCKVIADIIEKELELKPTPPTSTDPDKRRVFIYNQNFTLPSYDHMLIVVSETPGRVIGSQSRFDDVNDKEIQEVVMQKEIGIDILSRNSEARNRKEEVLMALQSIYSQQKQEENGMKIFGYSMSFVDVSEAEGAGQINRYRASIFLHVRYIKEKDVDYFATFDYNIHYN